MVEHKGWIALDIDGTITDAFHRVPRAVSTYLHSLHQQGWQLIFITGRTFSFGLSVLQELNFPFFFAVQNGADILHLPDRELVSRNYLSGSVLASFQKMWEGNEENFILYAGFEKGDFCYYRPERFSPTLMPHLEKIKALSPEPWQVVHTFEFAKRDAFPLIKCLGTEDEMKRMHASVENFPTITATLIRDPLAENLYLNLVTDRQANKGNALEKAIMRWGKRGDVIAAGDDRNDLSMLRIADLKIVMQTAPLEMRKEADIVAKPAADLGIIDALKEAVTHAR